MAFLLIGKVPVCLNPDIHLRVGHWSNFLNAMQSDSSTFITQSNPNYGDDVHADPHQTQSIRLTADIFDDAKVPLPTP